MDLHRSARVVGMIAGVGVCLLLAALILIGVVIILAALVVGY